MEGVSKLVAKCKICKGSGHVSKPFNPFENITANHHKGNNLGIIKGTYPDWVDQHKHEYNYSYQRQDVQP